MLCEIRQSQKKIILCASAAKRTKSSQKVQRCEVEWWLPEAGRKRFGENCLLQEGEKVLEMNGVDGCTTMECTSCH